MKGEKKVIDNLNKPLSDELTAINQYMVHSKMRANWGYTQLHEKIEKRAIDEIKHAESLIARILFLEGVPVVSYLNLIHIGKNIPEFLKNDQGAEEGAIKN
jgi:bacterioferritin